MLRADTFWTSEKDAPLLTLNKGYLQAQGEPLFNRVSEWLPSVGVAPLGGVVILDVEKPDRIFVADAERTFRNDANRATFVKLIAHLAAKFGDYHQGLSYVASFLSLTLPEADVVALCTHLNDTEKYLPGYWKHETVKFATDAYVFQELALKFVPEVAQHLQRNGVDPTSYAQKWFVGLCVHVLPFEFLFQYFEGFLAGGYKFLMQFGLSLVKQLQDKLLAVNNNFSVFLGLLRLDPKIIAHNAQFDEMLQRVFEGVKDFDLDGIDFKELREQTYNKYLKQRMEAAKNVQVDSDDEIEDCEICKDEFPEVYCKECKLKICEICHNEPPAGSKHLRSHKVKELDEDEEEEKEEEDDDGDEEEEEEKTAKPANGDASVDKATADLEKLNVK